MLWSNQSMNEYETEDDSSDGEEHTCPWDGCGYTTDTEQGLKVHHKRVHGESIAGVLTSCDRCGDDYRARRRSTRQNDGNYCSRECWRKSKEGVYSEQLSSSDLSREEVKAHILELSERLGRRPTGPEMTEMGGCGVNSAHRKFGSWKDALEACGLLNWRDEDTLRELYWRDGLDMYEMADELGCSPATVHRQMHKYGIETQWPSGSAHSLFQGGTPDYGPGWNEAKKEAVRERDGRECQHCGRSEAEHIQMLGRKHDVHHIRKARSIDDPEIRNSMDNLVTLCQGDCHKRWEAMSPLRPVTADD